MFAESGDTEVSFDLILEEQEKSVEPPTKKFKTNEELEEDASIPLDKRGRPIFTRPTLTENATNQQNEDANTIQKKPDQKDSKTAIENSIKLLSEVLRAKIDVDNTMQLVEQYVTHRKEAKNHLDMVVSSTVYLLCVKNKTKASMADIAQFLDKPIYKFGGMTNDINVLMKIVSLESPHGMIEAAFEKVQTLLPNEDRDQFISRVNKLMDLTCSKGLHIGREALPIVAACIGIVAKNTSRQKVTVKRIISKLQVRELVVMDRTEEIKEALLSASKHMHFMVTEENLRKTLSVVLDGMDAVLQLEREVKNASD
jgi:hypothetical protein